MSEIYRDPTLALRAQVELRRGEIHDRLERVTQDFWSLLPDALALELGQLKLRAEHDARTSDGLLDALTASEAYLAALDRAIARAAQLDAATLAHAARPPQPETARYLRPVSSALSDALDNLALVLRARVLRRDISAALAPCGPAARMVRFTAAPGPVALIGALDDPDDMPALRLSIAAPAACPPLRVVSAQAPRRSVVGRALAVICGDTAPEAPGPFDRLFRVEAAEGAGHPCLTAALRSALLELPQDPRTVLEIDRAVVTLSWVQPLLPDPLDHARAAP